MILIFKHVFFRFWENYFYNSKWHISVRKSSPNDEIHSNYMTGNDYSFTGNERKLFPFCINLPKDLIIVYAKVQLNILSGLGVINFGTLFRLIAQCALWFAYMIHVSHSMTSNYWQFRCTLFPNGTIF